MTIYQWLCLLGIPSLLGALFTYIVTTFKKQRAELDAIKRGLQALLRSELLGYYNKYSELGYAPISIRDNFENCWKQYHSLGENGVMDNIHEDFLRLPVNKG